MLLRTMRVNQYIVQIHSRVWVVFHFFKNDNEDEFWLNPKLMSANEAGF